MATASLLWSVFFGAIASGFLIYAKKQREPVPLYIGASLLLIPYLVSNIYLMVGLCTLVSLSPYFLKRF